MTKIYGMLVDEKTRCVHYHSEWDIVALKCFECLRYYPCYQCHNACENHVFKPYPVRLSEDKVVYCGNCQSELTIAAYRGALQCPHCAHAFNPGCQQHYDVYFDF